MNLCISCPYYGMSIWSVSSSDSNRLGKSSLIFGLSGAYNCKSGKTSLILSEFEQNRRISGIFREDFPKTSIRDHNQLLFREDFPKSVFRDDNRLFSGKLSPSPFHAHNKKPSSRPPILRRLTTQLQIPSLQTSPL